MRQNRALAVSVIDRAEALPRRVLKLHPIVKQNVKTTAKAVHDQIKLNDRLGPGIVGGAVVGAHVDG